MSFLNRMSASSSSFASWAAFASWFAVAASFRSFAVLKRLRRRSATGAMAATSSPCVGFAFTSTLATRSTSKSSYQPPASSLALRFEDEIRVGDRLKLGRLVIGLERLQDLLGAVHEIEDIGRVLAGMTHGSGATASAPPGCRRGGGRHTCRTAAADRSRSGICWRRGESESPRLRTPWRSRGP